MIEIAPLESMIEFSKPVIAKCCAVAVIAVIGARAVLCLKRWNVERYLKEKAEAKRKMEQDFIQSQMDVLSGEINLQLVDQVLKLTATQLLEEMRSGRLKPINVLKIYLYKACKVTQSFNCVTDIIRENFEFVENLRIINPKDCPLYGLPVSIKESFGLKGAPVTLGLVNWIDNICDDDSNIVKVLKHLGAVPFVRTNLPQIMFSFESDNPIYGGTCNPHNPDFGPGGSSSGEGCLIGARGSVLGFGTDIGGSIRVPSQICGICSLKVTRNRLSGVGERGTAPGLSAIKPSLGPMAQDVDTIVLAMRALLCDYMFELDPYVIPIPFRDQIFTSTKPLRIGYEYDNGYAEPIPACKRAVKVAKEALEKAGHTLVPYKTPDTEYLMDICTRAVFVDGGQTHLELLKKDLLATCLQHLYGRLTMSLIPRRICAALTSIKYPRLAKDLLNLQHGSLSAKDLWDNRAKINAYAAKFLNEWRNKYQIDAVIGPVFPLVACPKGSLENITSLWSYTKLYSAVDCPAGVVTVTKVTEQDVKDLDGYKGHYNDPWDKHLQQACKESINMPVGVQCASYPLHEEVVLRVMKEIETMLVK